MTLTEKPKIDFQLTFTVNEAEAKALDALSGYCFDNFIKVFKEHLGKHYMDGHEETLRKIFTQFRAEIPTSLTRLSNARKAFTDF